MSGLEANGPSSIGYTLGKNPLEVIFRCLYTTTGKIESGNINFHFLPSRYQLIGSIIYLQKGSCDNMNGITYIDLTSPQPAASYKVANNFLNLTEGTVMPTWTFCYKATQYGEGNLLFQCEKNGIYSTISNVNITVYPQQTPSNNDVPSSVFYLLNPIITLVLLLVLFVIRRKYLQNRIRQQQQLRAHQQQRSQRRPPTRVTSYAEPQFSIDSMEELTDGIYPIIRVVSVTRNNSNDSNNANNNNHHGGLSPEMIATIPIEKYQIKPEEEICVICQSNFEENDSVRRLNCNHFYHVPCIDAWLNKSLSCPICVTNVMAVV